MAKQSGGDETAGNDSRRDSAGTRAARVSIIVPAYNRERYLGLTLDSVRAQTFEDWELVVFDDGSTDGTLAIAQRYAERDLRIRVAQGPNGGVAAARNRGYAETDPTTDFVIFFDSDDLWVPDALETFIAALDAHPEYVGVHCLANCIDDDGQPLPGDNLEQLSRDRRGFKGRKLVTVAPDEPTTFGDLVYHTWIVTPGVHLIRRDALRRAGEIPFDPETDPADDADLWTRLARFGDVGFIDRALLRWRRHPETLTNTSRRWGMAALRVRAKTLTDLSNTPEQHAAMRQAYLHAVADMLREGRLAFTRRDYKRAVWQAVKAANLYQAYVRASLSLQYRRVRARFRGAR
jgi:cellulose synthase/poly-beta-1,6-N-acetylglucosamine synthase-like glycosyltransferase